MSNLWKSDAPPGFTHVGTVLSGSWPLWLVWVVACVAGSAGCLEDRDPIAVPAPTVGSLRLTVTPESAAVALTDPAGEARLFTGSQQLGDLSPGIYSATATAPGFGDVTSEISVIAGQASRLALHLTLPTARAVGSLQVQVVPWIATVVVSGPAGFTQTFVGKRFLDNLAPGSFTASVTAPGYRDATATMNVVAGQTSSLAFVLARASVTRSPAFSLAASAAAP